MMLAMLLLLVSIDISVADFESCAAHLWRVVKANSTKNTLYLYQPNYDVDFLHGLQNQTVFVSNLKPRFYTGKLHFDSLLLSFGDMDVLNKFLNSITYRDFMEDGNCAALVVCHKHISLDVLFSTLWKYNLANIIVLDRNGNAYTYYPISAGSPDRAVYMGGCWSVHSFSLESHQMYFPEVTLDIAGNYYVPKVTSIDYESDPGLEIALLRTLTKALQFRIEYNCRTCKSKEDFGGWYVAHVACGGLITLENHPNDDYIYYIIQRRYAFVVPAPKQVQPWLNILYIFRLHVWIFILTVTLLVGLVYRSSGEFNRLDLALLYTLSILVSSTWKIPTKLAPFFATWAFAALLLTNSYTSLLVSFMFKDLREPKLKSLDDVAGSKMDVRYYYKLPGSISKSQYCGIVSTACYDMLLKNELALYDDIDRVAYFLRSFKNPPFYYVPVSQAGIGGEYSQYFIEKGSPFKARLEQLLRRLEQAGIVFHMQNYKWRNAVIEESGFANISMEHLYFIFGFYIVGVILALVGFVVEMLTKVLSVQL